MFFAILAFPILYIFFWPGGSTAVILWGAANTRFTGLSLIREIHWVHLVYEANGEIHWFITLGPLRDAAEKRFTLGYQRFTGFTGDAANEGFIGLS